MGMLRLRLILPISIAQRARSFSIRINSRSSSSILLRQSPISGSFPDLTIVPLRQPPAELSYPDGQVFTIHLPLDLLHDGATDGSAIRDLPDRPHVLGRRDAKTNGHRQIRMLSHALKRREDGF